MDYLQAIGIAVTVGTTLGAIVAGFFAARQKSRTVLLEAIAKDYEVRVKQLESDRDSLKITVEQQAEEIKKLKTEKALPLTKLTELIITQHTENQESIIALTNAIADAANIKKPVTRKKKV